MTYQDYEITSLVKQAKKRKSEDYWERTRGEDAFNRILTMFEGDFNNFAFNRFISGADKQDVIQECRIGLINAVDDYDENSNMSFRSFGLHVCVKRHLLTVISKANRKKCDIHNKAVSLNTPIIMNDDYSEQTLADIMPDTQTTMLDNIIVQEEYDMMYQELNRRCTPLERRVLAAYSPDESYKEMALSTQSKAKTIDNALMRIRKKAEDIKREFEKKSALEEQKLTQVQAIRTQKDKQTLSSVPVSTPLPPPKMLSSEDEISIVIMSAQIKFDQIRAANPGVDEDSLLHCIKETFTPIEQVMFISYYSGDDMETMKSIFKEITTKKR